MASNNMDKLVKLVISEQNVQKLKLRTLKSIGELKRIIALKTKIQHEFILQYLDTDFDDYFNLDDLDNVRHLGTIKVLKANDEAIVEVSNPEVSSVQLNSWPEVFPLPNFCESVFIKSNLENLASKCE